MRENIIVLYTSEESFKSNWTRVLCCRCRVQILTCSDYGDKRCNQYKWTNIRFFLFFIIISYLIVLHNSAGDRVIVYELVTSCWWSVALRNIFTSKFTFRIWILFRIIEMKIIALLLAVTFVGFFILFLLHYYFRLGTHTFQIFFQCREYRYLQLMASAPIFNRDSGIWFFQLFSPLPHE